MLRSFNDCQKINVVLSHKPASAIGLLQLYNAIAPGDQKLQTTEAGLYGVRRFNQFLSLTRSERAVVDKGFNLIDERAELITGCFRRAVIDLALDLLKLIDQAIALILFEAPFVNQCLQLSNERADGVRCCCWKSYLGGTISDWYGGGYRIRGRYEHTH